MESCGNCQRRRLFHSKIETMAEQMNGRFLKQDPQTMVYYFKHTMIYEAIAISYYEVNPSEVISVLNFDFIIDLIQLEFENFGKQKIGLIIAKNMFEHLAKRLLALFEKEYIMRSAEFIKTLCDSEIILQNNPVFIGFLTEEFNNCTPQDTIDIHIEGKHDQMPFHFPRALLWFLIQKHNVDKHIATVLHFIENDIKVEQYLEKFKASKKVVVACFYYLCETDNSDMKLELIYGLINEYKIECNYDYSIQIALKNGNDSAVSFLLGHVPTEIDIVDLVLEVEQEEDITRLCDLLSTNLSLECIDTYNKIDNLKILFRSLPLNLFNLRKFIKTACVRLCKDLVIEILIDARQLTFDTGNIVNTACENGWEDVLKILLNKKLCNQNEKKQIFTSSCKDGNETFLKWIDIITEMINLKLYSFIDLMLQHVDYSKIDIKESLNDACFGGKLETVKWLIENFDNTLFDMKEAMNKACGSENTDVVKWLIENVDNNLFDMKEAFNNACGSENLDTVKMLFESFDNKSFDLTEVMNNACGLRNIVVVKWLIDNFDITVLNMKEAIEIACLMGNLDTVKWLIDNVNHELFDMKEAMNNACWSKNLDIVKLLIDNFDNNLFDMKEAMKNVCLTGKLDTVKWLLQHFENTIFDMKDAMNNACGSENLDTVKWLKGNIDNELFDMKEAMENACLMGTLDTVKWLIDTFDNKLFDMQESMNKVCWSKNLDIVKWLIENFDNNLFDMKEAMNNACGSENLDIVKWLMENVDNALFDMQTAMTKALR
ncbi:uncharacterized protein LOC134693550 [Mytilus trossulus]|uniref:uncharacterized protein LOC134693550 n=1 Tax=Mytilus trossulus TaxID=6551 RepID=UPI0030066EA8